jgi:hypothetical protein
VARQDGNQVFRIFEFNSTRSGRANAVDMQLAFPDVTGDDVDPKVSLMLAYGPIAMSRLHAAYFYQSIKSGR